MKKIITEEPIDSSKKSAEKSLPKRVKKVPETLLETADKILKEARGSELSKEFFTHQAQNIQKVGDILHTNPMETVLLLSILEIGRNSTDLDDLARFFSLSNVSMLARNEEFGNLVKMKLLRRSNGGRFNNSTSYIIPKGVVEALKSGMPYTTPNNHCDTWEDLFSRLDELYGLLDENEILSTDHENEVDELFQENQHLRFVTDFQKYTGKLSHNDTKLLLLFCMLYVKSEDDDVNPRQWEFIFEQRMQARRIDNALADGSSQLIARELIEISSNEGRALRNTYKLTDSAKMKLIPEACKNSISNTSKYLRDSNKIPEKQLFYNKEEQRKIDELANILKPEQFKKIQKKLEDKGLRKGICCLLHGGPGTGKTETTYQLARATGRDLFQVDMTLLRSKWVGDSEKEVQAMFNEYAALVRKSEKAPILLINEADGILTTRMTGAQHSVDKMENAIQNIFLQNMEDLEGILIATTNLAANLDPAFERRFLFKIHFDKPCFEAKKCIWKSMLPEINDDDAGRLANEFDFSGGQIENICRKKSINDLLSDKDTDFNQLHQYCKDEQIKKEGGSKQIGFNK